MMMEPEIQCHKQPSTRAERVALISQSFANPPTMAVLEQKFFDGPKICMEGFTKEHELRLPLGLGQLVRSLVGWRVEDVEWISAIDQTENPDGSIGFYRVYVTK